MQKARRLVVWFSTLLCTLLLVARAGALSPTVCPATISGTLSGSSPVQTGDRLFRNAIPATCAGAKPNPGTFATPGSRAYDLYSFTNNTGASACYTFVITSTVLTAQMVAYSTYVPTSAATNYLADTGNVAATETMSLTIANGDSFQVVVTAYIPGTTPAYNMTVSGCGPGAAVSLSLAGPNPSVFGQSATFNTIVTGSNGTPTGTATFMDGASSLGTVALDATGNASLSTASLSAGTHSITVQYSGDSNYTAKTSSAGSQVVSQASTTTTLSSSQNPQNVSTAVTFTATVAAVLPGDGTPTGSVEFFDGATSLGTGTLALGQATLTTSALIAGTHPITAVYGADANFTGSTSSTVSQVIDPAAATVAVVGTPSTTTYGTAVQFDATVSASAGGTPTGTITFKDGTSQIAVVSLVGGVASYTTAALTVGTHTIFAEYSGDVNHNAATGSTGQTVNLAPSTSALASLVNPSVSGQAVTFTGTVSGGVGVPTGLVTLYDGATMIGSATLDAGGTATFASAALAVGTHPLTLVYDGDTIYATSTSSILSQVVNKSGTTVSINSSQNPQGVGAVVTFSTTVSAGLPGTGTPTGTASFYDNTGTRHLMGAVALINGQATLDVSTLTVGTHAITIDYGGDTNFSLASSPSLFEIIDPVASGITLTTTPNPSSFGGSVQIQATVAPGTGGTPTGSITFTDGGTSLGAVPLDGAGSAMLALSTLTVGSHTIGAAYTGDGNHNAATATLSHTVNKAATVTVMTSSVNPSVFGQTTTLTATVTSSVGTPAGNVVFKEGTTILGTVALDGSGVATIDLSDLSVGDHVIAAAYSGSATLDISATAEPTQVVSKAATTVSVTSSSNPVIVGTGVTFTATLQVTAPGAGSPTGNVAFKEGTTVLGTVALSGGTASFVTSTLAVGTHDIVAVYAGDASFLTSTSSALTQTVQAAGVTMALSVAPTSTVYGQSATLTAIANATTGGTPTGTIAFTEGATSLGMATLASGSATLALGTLGVGTHSITATYSGDGNHPAGANATVQLTVTKRGTRSALTSSVNPSSVGQATTLTATITIEPLAADAGGSSGGVTPLTGSVAFSDGQTVIGTGTVTNGTATLAVSSLTVGSHALSAAYQGAANYDESASAALVQNVFASDGGVDGGGPTDDGGTRDTGVRDTSIDGGTTPDVTVTPDSSVPPADSGPGNMDARVVDAGPLDSGTAVDARDGAVAVADATTSTDAATKADAAKADAATPGGDTSDDSGCSCRVASRSTGLGGLYVLGLGLGLVAMRRRNRNKR